MGNTDPRTTAAVAATRAVMLPEVCMVPDLAQALRRTPAAIRSMLRRGLLPGRKLGRTWVVPRTELLRQLSSDTTRFRLVPK